jgi:hypothetical protein
METKNPISKKAALFRISVLLKYKTIAGINSGGRDSRTNKWMGIVSPFDG